MDVHQNLAPPKQLTLEKLQHAFAILSPEVTAIIRSKWQNASVRAPRKLSHPQNPPHTGNEEKDRGKEFEGSYTRVIFIMVVTYCTLFGYMSLIGTKDAYLNAIVPTLGFNISTWSLPYVKELWIRFKERNEVVVVKVPVRQFTSTTHSDEVDVELGDT